MSEALVVSSRERVGITIRADALELPFADKSFDLVTCSQTLHHFDDADAVRVIRELDRVARARDRERHSAKLVRRCRNLVRVVSARLSSHQQTRWRRVGVSRFHGSRAARHDPQFDRTQADRSAAAGMARERELESPGRRESRVGNLRIGEGPMTDLGPMPLGRPMQTVDELMVAAPVKEIFSIASDVENWPGYLPHYRYVRFRRRDSDSAGLVEMSANRPFGAVNWPTWWVSEMRVDHAAPAIRFRHVGGITTGMDVEWTFVPEGPGTRVRILHVWDGPRWPLIGLFAAMAVIGPIFVHGIASRTLAGLARVAERGARDASLVRLPTGG
jgi:ribosome-associated toxin RatA of RatAB toxin-antitoxin module